MMSLLFCMTQFLTFFFWFQTFWDTSRVLVLEWFCAHLILKYQWWRSLLILATFPYLKDLIISASLISSYVILLDRSGLISLLVGISHPAMTVSSIDSVETILCSSFLSRRFDSCLLAAFPLFLKMFCTFVADNFSIAYSSPSKYLTWNFSSRIAR